MDTAAWMFGATYEIIFLHFLGAEKLLNRYLKFQGISQTYWSKRRRKKRHKLSVPDSSCSCHATFSNNQGRVQQLMDSYSASNQKYLSFNSFSPRPDDFVLVDNCSNVFISNNRRHFTTQRHHHECYANYEVYLVLQQQYNFPTKNIVTCRRA